MGLKLIAKSTTLYDSCEKKEEGGKSLIAGISLLHVSKLVNQMPS